jgi:hypothetical protein
MIAYRTIEVDGTEVFYRGPGTAQRGPCSCSTGSRAHQRHANRAVTTALALANDDRATRAVEVRLGQLEGLRGSAGRAPQRNNDGAQASAIGPLACARIIAIISSQPGSHRAVLWA